MRPRSSPTNSGKAQPMRILSASTSLRQLSYYWLRRSIMSSPDTLHQPIAPSSQGLLADRVINHPELSQLWGKRKRKWVTARLIANLWDRKKFMDFGRGGESIWKGRMIHRSEKMRQGGWFRLDLCFLVLLLLCLFWLHNINWNMNRNLSHSLKPTYIYCGGKKRSDTCFSVTAWKSGQAWWYSS